MKFLKNALLCHTLQKKTPFLHVFLAILAFFYLFFPCREASKLKNTLKNAKFKKIKKHDFAFVFILEVKRLSKNAIPLKKRYFKRYSFVFFAPKFDLKLCPNFDPFFANSKRDIGAF